MNPAGAPHAASLSDAIADHLLNAMVFGRRQLVRASRFGSPASMVAASAVGAIACAGALLTWPASPIAIAETPRVVEASSGEPGAPAPMVGLPPPPVQIALDYEVDFFWPKTPQTVAEPVSIREGPADYAKAIRAARPGERLRINGVVEDAPDGPWYRARLEDGRDGYFAAKILEVGAFRARRAAERSLEAATAPEGATSGVGAPLVVAGPGEPDVGPPSF